MRININKITSDQFNKHYSMLDNYIYMLPSYYSNFDKRKVNWSSKDIYNSKQFIFYDLSFYWKCKIKERDNKIIYYICG